MPPRQNAIELLGEIFTVCLLLLPVTVSSEVTVCSAFIYYQKAGDIVNRIINYNIDGTKTNNVNKKNIIYTNSFSNERKRQSLVSLFHDFRVSFLVGAYNAQVSSYVASVV